jgi:two-component system phosphate regulon sensor histidine kinase PhoR
LATSSSAERKRPLAPLLLRAAAPYVVLLGAAVLALALWLEDGGWVLLLTFVATAAASAVVTAVVLLPRLRRLREATAAAEALAAGRFDARVATTGDDIDALASALNRAAADVEQTVGALRQERAQLEALLNASSDAAIAIDRDGTVVYMNAAARGAFATDGADALGRPFIEAVRDHDLHELMLAAARGGERSVRVVAYGPAQRWLQATAVPITEAGSWAALAVFHDLTEVRRLDSVRRDFISNVSHELRTPLAGIRAAAETLQEGALQDEAAAREFLGHIQRETDRMTQMVEELLELSRIESGAAPMRFAQVDAAELVEDAAKRFARQAERAGLTLHAEAETRPLHVIGDMERLERALGNLVANAIKFTPAGGSVTLRAREIDGDVAIEVADTGVGIEPGQLGRVFERFFKADRGRGDGGTGLGLAIVKHVAQAHHGTVSVESRPGRGATFTMRLPRR